MRSRKPGRGFFLALLTLSGLLVIALYTLFFQGRAVHVFTFKKFVINKAFVSLLPHDYTLEEAEAIREEVYRFYDQADKLTDQSLSRVSLRIQKIMSNNVITQDEVTGLLILIKEQQAR